MREICIDYKQLGNRIRTERKRQLLTQGKLAEMVEISPSFLGHIERGTRKASVETIIGLSLRLGISMDELFTESYDMIYGEKNGILI